MSVFLKVTLNRPIRRESRIDLSRQIGEAAHDDADRRRSRARGREDARDAREKYIASFRGVAGRMVASKATLAVREGVETEDGRLGTRGRGRRANEIAGRLEGRSRDARAREKNYL